MTVYLRDMSHYDSNLSLSGFMGTTHKVTEGSSYVDNTFQTRMNQYRTQGVTVLGSYHVLRTGNLQAQLSYWLSTLDRLTPWWRTYPYWIQQIDAERWPYDDVSPQTVLDFARLCKDSGMPGRLITYASKGEYGDSLSGIVTPLWNADYVSASYPGDSGVGWWVYSGQKPKLLQYTSSPFDKNAFIGSSSDFLAWIKEDSVTVPSGTIDFVNARVEAMANLADNLNPDRSPLGAQGVAFTAAIKEIRTNVSVIKDMAGGVLSDSDRQLITTLNTTMTDLLTAVNALAHQLSSP